MPKLTDKNPTDLAVEKLLTDLLQKNGIGIRHQLTERVEGLSPGTWVFGTLKLVKGKPVITYSGYSSPILMK